MKPSRRKRKIARARSLRVVLIQRLRIRNGDLPRASLAAERELRTAVSGVVAHVEYVVEAGPEVEATYYRGT